MIRAIYSNSGGRFPSLGVQEKIIQGYSFICHNYNVVDNQGDRIILVGFSRGAFIARCIASLVHSVGLLTKLGIHYVGPVYRLWREAGEKGGLEEIKNMFGGSDFEAKYEFGPAGPEEDASTKQQPPPNELDEWLKVRIKSSQPDFIRRGIRVEVCTLFDTVSALGRISPRCGLFRPQANKRLHFIMSELSPGIQNAFQALSLHDRRRSFLPMVWCLNKDDSNASRPDSQPILGSGPRLEQCWFMGYHSDVGGGIKGEGLAHFALAWMLARLATFIDMDLDNFWAPYPNTSNWMVTFPGIPEWLVPFANRKSPSQNGKSPWSDMRNAWGLTTEHPRRLRCFQSVSEKIS